MKKYLIYIAIACFLLNFLSPEIILAAGKDKTKQSQPSQHAPPPPAPPAEPPTPLPLIDNNDPYLKNIDANAKLQHYGFRDFDYYFIVPDNINGYKYLFKNMPAGFVFVNINPDKLRSLSVKNIKSGSLGQFEKYDMLRFENIIGMEQLSIDIKNMDMFGVEEKKGQIIDKLLYCQNKYREEYNEYLKIRYRFNAIGKNTDTKEYYKYFQINKKFIVGYGYPYSYDFDNKVLSFDTFNPKSRHLAEKDMNSWEYQYIIKYNSKYRNRKEFPIKQKISLGVEDAKKIFQGDSNIFAETIFDVSLSNGLIGYHVLHNAEIQNMNMNRIIKKFYRDKPGNDNSMVVIEIRSTNINPLN